MELDVRLETQDGLCVVTVEGEVDVYTSPLLRDHLHKAVDEGCDVLVVSLEGVGFIDSSGLGVLVGALRRVRERGGDMRIVCSRESTLKVFRITGLDKVLPLFATLEQAREV